jgi:nitroreductase
MLEKPATTAVTIHELIQNRWSPRAFSAEKAVSREDLLALCEAARWAASSYNDQPWRFVVCDKFSDEENWQQALETLVPKNQLWAKNAPVLILAVAMKNFTHNGQPNRCAMYDTGAASASLCLQATALGLHTHQMGGFDADKARAVFNLPEDCSPMAMIAAGYQAEADVLEDEFKAAESAARSRAALQDRFFAGQWGIGFEL